jgi:uncharacterized protein YciI
MAKMQFFFRINPPRPTFAADITEQERALMKLHAEYVRGAFDKGMVLAYGPVLDPAGAFGMALIEAQDLAEVKAFARLDPSIQAGLNGYSIFPMRIAAAQGCRNG